MRLRGLALAGPFGALALACSPLALAQDEGPAAPTAPGDASSVEAGGASVLLGPGEEGIGPLASAPAPAQPSAEAAAAEAVTPEAVAAPEAPKRAAAKRRSHAPAKAVRRFKRHNEG